MKVAMSVMLGPSRARLVRPAVRLCTAMTGMLLPLPSPVSVISESERPESTSATGRRGPGGAVLSRMASSAEKTTTPEAPSGSGEGPADPRAPVTMLFDEAEIARRVGALAPEISRAIAGDFTIVALLKGAFVFVADLVRALDGIGRHPRSSSSP